MTNTKKNMSKKIQQDKNEQRPAGELRATVRALQLPGGLYRFSVNKATPLAVPEAGNLLFPALHVAPGPGAAPNAVRFVGNPDSIGAWLYKPDDHLIVKIANAGATLVLSSVRADGNQALDITVDPMDASSSAAAIAAARAASTQPVAPGLQASAVAATDSLKIQIGLHIRNYGDLRFAGSDWAGLVAQKLWIEAMSIAVLETLSSRDLEYKGLSANGFETPWISDGAACGTKGISMPLIGFAVRLKPDAMASYDCEYSGTFLSGAIVGPIKNGVPCRSKTASDPLLGIQLQIVKRGSSVKASVAPRPAAVSDGKGPKFGKFREDDVPDVAGVSAQKKKASVPAKGMPKAASTVSKPKKRTSKIGAAAKRPAKSVSVKVVANKKKTGR